jgi:chromosome partitioning protein
MRTIAIVNQKGGCGKTITSINLSAFLALDKKVLLVDMDPQGHATLGLSSDTFQPSLTMYDLFVRNGDGQRAELADIACPMLPNLDLAPASILLSAVPEKLAGTANRENILAEAVARLGDRYDFVVVDCAPNVGLLTFNAVMACSEAIVPMDPSFFSLHGIGKVFETFDMLEQETGHHVSPRVLVTLYPGRSSFVKAVLEDVYKHLDGRVYQTFIRYSVKLAEAASHGVPITRYCRHCVGYDDYHALTEEVLRDGLSRSEPESDVSAGFEEENYYPSDGGDDQWSEPPGTVVTPAGVVFTMEAPGAERVQLVGDFNGWMTEGSEMQHDGRFWRKVLPLHPGRYLYRFVVDGQWLTDPLNNAVEPCPGGYNSVLVLGRSPAAEVSVN